MNKICVCTVEQNGKLIFYFNKSIFEMLVEVYLIIFCH